MIKIMNISKDDIHTNSGFENRFPALMYDFTYSIDVNICSRPTIQCGTVFDNALQTGVRGLENC